MRKTAKNNWVTNHFGESAYGRDKITGELEPRFLAFSNVIESFEGWEDGDRIGLQFKKAAFKFKNNDKIQYATIGQIHASIGLKNQKMKSTPLMSDVHPEDAKIIAQARDHATSPATITPYQAQALEYNEVA